ncbi:hypothetical protein SK128_024031, partial [Halocaridina rubra]
MTKGTSTYERPHSQTNGPTNTIFEQVLHRPMNQHRGTNVHAHAHQPQRPHVYSQFCIGACT